MNLMETAGTLTEIEVNDHERELLADAMQCFIEDMEPGERRDLAVAVRDLLTDFQKNSGGEPQ